MRVNDDPIIRPVFGTGFLILWLWDNKENTFIHRKSLEYCITNQPQGTGQEFKTAVEKRMEFLQVYHQLDISWILKIAQEYYSDLFESKEQDQNDDQTKKVKGQIWRYPGSNWGRSDESPKEYHTQQSTWRR